MKEVILDTETTGLSVKEGHRIVEIGCIELDNLIPTKNKFHCYLKIIIHNAEFDISHINNELKLIGKKELDNSNVVDTLTLAREKYPGSNASLDALCKRFRIDNSRREKHNALIDCELLSKVYINLLDQKEPSLNFSTQNIVEENFKNISNQDYSKKVVPNSKEEFELHKSFIKSKMKKNYF